ncbi:glycosyltransferase domain-containing protein [Microvirga sp. TS319]|uniref:glycosyltransferase domain-containing protein n=1 Tax=Microvirga sp. TS319 TaxID=3241165 RepID=UPI00351A127E
MTEDALHNQKPDRLSGIERDPSALQAEIRRLGREVEDLQGEIRSLQAEIRGMKNSLYWKMTVPLRFLARRLPRLTRWGRQGVEALKDAVATGLPRQASQAFLDNRWRVSDDIERQITAYQHDAVPRDERKIVFYTAIFGEYDNLLLPDTIDPGIDYVCFTDRPRNTYGIWQMRSPPYQHPDPTRVARYVKMHPHELFPTHEFAVWLDANIILKGDIRKYIDMIRLETGDLGLVSHPHRACFYDEAEACRQLKKDAAAVIQEQVDYYRERGLPANHPLYETGFMIVPMRSDKTREAFRSWWQQIERFSRRDQLGLAWTTHEHRELRIVPLLPEGCSVRDHADFTYYRHSYARALVVPDVLLRLGSEARPAGRDPSATSPNGTHSS